MPKKTLELLQNTGLGINELNPRLLKRGEFSSLIDYFDDGDGIIRPVGSFESYLSRTVIETPGYNLFSYVSEYDNSGNLAPTEWIFIQGDVSEIDAWERIIDSTTTIRDNVIDMLSNADSKFVFHVVGGNVRVCDSNFHASSRPRWRGYINRSRFDDASDTYTDDGWYTENNDLPKPVAGNFYASGDILIGETITTGQVHVKLLIFSSGSPDEWMKVWECGVSFVYDDNQETLIRLLSGTYDLTVEDFSNIGLRVHIGGSSSNKINSRITGIKVYLREYSTDSWLLQGIWDIKRGGKLPNDDDYYGWMSIASGALFGTGACYYAYSNNQHQSEPQLLSTYHSENGFSPDEKSIDIGQLGDGWKTSVVINNSTYVGNVKRTNKDGIQVIENDSIYKSVPGRNDTFPLSGKLTSLKGDGEAIVKLEKYADRILEFKEKTLRIINVSRDIEYVEATHRYKGIKIPAASCDTDFGIAWVNTYGIYLYDGSKIHNLLERDGKPILKSSTWNSFVTDSSTIGYDPIKRQLIIVKSCESHASGSDSYMFSLLTGGLYYNEGAFSYSKESSNFFNDIDGNLLIFVDGALRKYTDTYKASTLTCLFALHDEFFDSPGVEKEIYRLFVIYRDDTVGGGTLSNKMQYALNGSSTFSQSSPTSLTGDIVQTVGDWSLAVFTFASPVECESIRFQFFPYSATSEVRIKSMVVEYRILGAKRVS